jgi:hypothetical protein
MDKPRTMSPIQRVGLLAFLWVLLAVIALVASNNLPVLFSHLPGVGVGCLGACGVVIAFSMIAGAIHISLDVARGKYPYTK